VLVNSCDQHPIAPSSALPTTALVLGVASIPAPFTLGAAGAVLSLTAIGLGVAAERRVRRGTASGRRFAIAGIGAGAAGLLAMAALIAAF